MDDGIPLMIKFSLQNVTSETVFSRELYCVMGCNEALNTYFQKLRGMLTTYISKKIY